MPFYAQLDGSNIVKAVTQTAAPIVAADMIELQSFDISKLRHEYVNGQFSADPIPAPNPPP